MYFGALRETNCGSKVKLLESPGSQKIREFLERWKNRLEKLDIESFLLPVVDGRREKDLIMWNVACALLWKLSHCTPLHRHNFSLSWTPDPALLWHLHFFRMFWIWWRSASTANKIPSYTWCVHAAPAHVIPKTLKVLRDPHAIIEKSPGLHRKNPRHLWLKWSPSVPPWSLCDAPMHLESNVFQTSWQRVL